MCLESVIILCSGTAFSRKKRPQKNNSPVVASFIACVCNYAFATCGCAEDESEDDALFAPDETAFAVAGLCGSGGAFVATSICERKSAESGISSIGTFDSKIREVSRTSNIAEEISGSLAIFSSVDPTICGRMAAALPKSIAASYSAVLRMIFT